MIESIANIVGGVGLFLAGMLILTDGLRALTGDWLRTVLSTYTKSPRSGVLTGAVSTALIQSSSATTVTAVSFVGAGLLTFPQALGIIFGANIGTTLTGWLVAILGFKIKLGIVVMPFILIGVALKLYGRGLLANVGWAIVGFSLLFIGIATMQQGASGFEGLVSPSNFPPDTIFGRLQLVAIGIAVTIITQSSSAGVAAAMVALVSGAISFPQAAAMVIGMDVGTTFSAALATIGGSTPMRRTGYAHVIYNVFTGAMAFLLLGPAAAILNTFQLTNPAADGAPFALALFHTSFNIAGVLLVLPFTNQFAALVRWLVPGQGPHLTDMLDKNLLAEPSAATDAVTFTVRQTVDKLLACLEGILARQNRPADTAGQLHEIELAIEATQAYAQTIEVEPESAAYLRQIEAMHALDHLRRLHRRCQRTHLASAIAKDWRLQRLSGLLRHSLQRVSSAGVGSVDLDYLAKLNGLMQRQDSAYRLRMLKAVPNHPQNSENMMLRLDGMRWLLRVSYHVWRINIHTKQDEESPS